MASPSLLESSSRSSCSNSEYSTSTTQGLVGSEKKLDGFAKHLWMKKRALSGLRFRTRYCYLIPIAMLEKALRSGGELLRVSTEGQADRRPAGDPPVAVDSGVVV